MDICINIASVSSPKYDTHKILCIKTVQRRISLFIKTLRIHAFDYIKNLHTRPHSYHNMSDAEDILQETLIRFLKTAPSFENAS